MNRDTENSDTRGIKFSPDRYYGVYVSEFKSYESNYILSDCCAKCGTFIPPASVPEQVRNAERHLAVVVVIVAISFQRVRNKRFFLFK